MNFYDSLDGESCQNFHEFPVEIQGQSSLHQINAETVTWAAREAG
jgi:hypothetical protein